MWRSPKERVLPFVPCGESMRARKEIEEEFDGTRKDSLILEVLLDLRDLIVKATKIKGKSIKGGK